MIGVLTRLWRCERGATAIEFALVVMPLILLTVGTIEVGRGLWIRNDMTQSLDRVERKILILQKVNASDALAQVKTCAGVTALANELRGAFSSAEIGALTDRSEVIGGATVTAKYRLLTVRSTMTLYIPLLNQPNITIAVSRQVHEPHISGPQCLTGASV